MLSVTRLLQQNNPTEDAAIFTNLLAEYDDKLPNNRL